MTARIWEKIMIQKTILIYSRKPPEQLPPLPYFSDLCFPTKVIKVTGIAFTAKHAKPIQDHSLHRSLKSFITLDTGRQPGLKMGIV